MRSKKEIYYFVAGELLFVFKCVIQYSPFITSHTRGIFSVGPCNFFRGKTENYAWHGGKGKSSNVNHVPSVEKGLTRQKIPTRGG